MYNFMYNLHTPCIPYSRSETVLHHANTRYGGEALRVIPEIHMPAIGRKAKERRTDTSIPSSRKTSKQYPETVFIAQTICSYSRISYLLPAIILKSYTFLS